MAQVSGARSVPDLGHKLMVIGYLTDNVQVGAHKLLLVAGKNTIPTGAVFAILSDGPYTHYIALHDTEITLTGKILESSPVQWEISSIDGSYEPLEPQ